MTVRVEEGCLRIGRSSDNTIVLQDSLVSRHHAELEFDGTNATIRDVGGKNPIRINGEEVSDGHTLVFGDRIAIGRTQLIFAGVATPESGLLRVLPDPEARFEPGAGSISLDAATVHFGKPAFTDSGSAEKVYERLSQLYGLSERLLSAADEEEVYDVVLATATEETGAERGFFGLVPEGEEFDPYALSIARFWDPESGKEAHTFEMSESILQHIQRERCSVLVRDVANVTDLGASVLDLNIRSFACVPITHRESLLGILYVDARGNNEQLERSDLEFVSAIGRMAGMSLANLRIYRRLQNENEKLRSLVGGGEELIGTSDSMKTALQLVEKVAPSDTSILVTGENGTGKELIARAIHKHSPRNEQPFVAVNCAAIPPQLVESELFGHEKGAFTGAYQTSEGKFDLANAGTLFLDEIGEMPLDMQVKILRALQERRFYRVGGQKEVSVDIRVISATNRELKQSIEDGAFREDLYFRLAVVTIEVPPLRERGDDALEIAAHFLDNGDSPIKLTKAAEECLMGYHWPGNVRELRNALEQGVILGDGKKITPSDLPPHIRKKGRGKMVFRLKPIAEIEKQYIFRVLEETEGNKAKAASILGISRETLYQKLKQYEKVR